ncbi:kelch-like [Rhizophlyctis rosea]|nr:kelch-like [Rhizophlyctis rosea]
MPCSIENTAVWTAKCKIWGARQAMIRASTTNEKTTFSSDPFGPDECRWKVEFILNKDGKDVDESPDSPVGAWCVAIKNTYELNSGNDWSRKTSAAITLHHPKGKEDFVRKDRDGTRPILATPNNRYGWSSFTTFTKFKDFIDTDGSVSVTVCLDMALSSTHAHSSTSKEMPFSNILLKDSLSDVTLLISSSCETVTLPAHKVLLASRSPYFNAMFTSGCQESTTPSTTIQITDFPANTIKSALEYTYTGTLSLHKPVDLDAYLDVIRAADYFQMSDLLEYMASQIIDKHLDSHHALRIFGFAIQYRGISDALAERVKGWMRSQWDHLVTQAEFRQSMREVDSSIIAEVFE